MRRVIYSNIENFTSKMCHLRSTLTIIIGISLCILYIIWSSKGELIQRPQNITINETTTVCNEMNFNKRMLAKFSNLVPIIYFVTPTYPRREQVAEITRLGQTLMHIPNIYWIVADDNDVCNPFLGKLLKKFDIPFTHISSPMPDIYRTNAIVPRGVSNRRAALSWIKNNQIKSGVLYFGDDDNTFDLTLFSEIRSTKRVSMFPVGLIGLYAVSAPIVRNGKVVGFFDSWPAKRKWPVDMAGFAVNLEYLSYSPNVTMPYRAGHEEDGFLRSLRLTLRDVEPKANNCTEILVWHTQTKKVKSPVIKFDSKSMDYDDTSLQALLISLESMGVSRLNISVGETARITSNGKTKEFTLWHNG